MIYPTPLEALQRARAARALAAKDARTVATLPGFHGRPGWPEQFLARAAEHDAAVAEFDRAIEAVEVLNDAR